MTRTLLIIPLFLIFVTRLTAAEPGGELVSGPYMLWPSAKTVTVCWQTKTARPGTVRFRKTGSPGWTSVETGATRFHAVRLTGMPQNAPTEIEVLAAESSLARLSYRLPAPQLDSFTFYVYGDTRSNPDAHDIVAKALKATAARKGQNTFVLLTGDLARYSSDEKDTVRQFFNPAKPWIGNMAMLPIKGNHECGTDLYEKYFPPPADDQKELTTNAGDYVVDYGSVRVIGLNQYEAASSSGPRMKWLKARLAEAADKWRIVAFHEPMYSSGSHGENTEWRALVEPLLVKGKVHAVFCGHDHDYERITPRSGVSHFVAGGGGAPLRSIGKGSLDYSAKFMAVHHFLTVEVTPDQLKLECHVPDADGKSTEVADSVTIKRDCDWPVEPADYGSAKRTGREAGEVHYLKRTNPWKNPMLIGSFTLLGLAILAKILRAMRGTGRASRNSPKN